MRFKIPQVVLFFALFFVTLNSCVKFDLPAGILNDPNSPKKKCLYVYIGQDVYVSGTLKSSIGYHMHLDVVVSDLASRSQLLTHSLINNYVLPFIVF